MQSFKDATQPSQLANEELVFQVLMKDITTPVPPEEIKNLVRRCLENAAQINYSQLIEYAQVKGEMFGALKIHFLP